MRIRFCLRRLVCRVVRRVRPWHVDIKSWDRCSLSFASSGFPIGQFQMNMVFSHVIAYEDKSLFKAHGPVWHKKERAKNHIPKGLRNVDKTANWSKSGYHEWIYGNYELHLTTTRQGFPVIFDVCLPTSMNAKSSIKNWIVSSQNGSLAWSLIPNTRIKNVPPSLLRHR